MSRTALSRKASIPEAVDQVLETLGSESAWILVLASEFHHPQIEALAAAFSQRSSAEHCLVVPALGIGTEAGEVESGPGLAALGFSADEAWPRVAVPPEESADAFALGQHLGEPLRESSSLVLLASPDVGWPEDLQRGLRAGHGGEPAVFGAGLGGGASSEPASIFVDGMPLVCPGLALGLPKNWKSSHALSVAWSPRGPTHRIDQVQGQQILKLDGRPAREVLLEDVGPELAARVGGPDVAVLLGVPLDPELDDLAKGQYLVRNLAGIHPRSQGLKTTSAFQVGDRIGFVVRHVPDAQRHFRKVIGELQAGGGASGFGLLFDCCARGQDFHGEADVDTQVVQGAFPGLPFLTIFGSFELAPLGDEQPLHAYTAVFLRIETPS